MPFSIRPYRCFPVHCVVTYNAGPFQGQGTVWNLSCTGWRLFGDLPMRPGETLSLTVTLPNETHITVADAGVRWSRGQECAGEHVAVERLLDPLSSFELLAGGGILDALATGRRHVRIRRHAWIEVMRCLGRVGIIAAFLHVLHARIHLGGRDSRNVGL